MPHRQPKPAGQNGNSRVRPSLSAYFPFGPRGSTVSGRQSKCVVLIATTFPPLTTGSDLS